ncbi:MAG TPA: helix-turn-helix transcriptional regulator [Solirubrobacteraceae bacterium]|nr:helix-turn-helix transcriptional regulator [Solirubrobacteraceae bacterium]
MPSGEDRLGFAGRRLTMMRAFGVRLQELRTKAGLSQDELAERCRLRVSAIKKAEDGQTDPRLSVIEALAKGLDVSPTSLIKNLTREGTRHD